MSQRVSENGENRKMLLHDRNWRYCREHSQKLHTNEKLHARERLRSESHFRLVNIKVGNTESFTLFLHFYSVVLYGEKGAFEVKLSSILQRSREQTRSFWTNVNS